MNLNALSLNCMLVVWIWMTGCKIGCTDCEFERVQMNVNDDLASQCGNPREFDCSECEIAWLNDDIERENLE